MRPLSPSLLFPLLLFDRNFCTFLYIFVSFCQVRFARRLESPGSNNSYHTLPTDNKTTTFHFYRSTRIRTLDDSFFWCGGRRIPLGRSPKAKETGPGGKEGNTTDGLLVARQPAVALKRPNVKPKFAPGCLLHQHRREEVYRDSKGQWWQ